MTLDSVIVQVCSQLKPGDQQEVMVDPATVLMVAKIIYELIRIVKGCKRSNASIKTAAQNPSLFESFIINRVVRRIAYRKTHAERSRIRESLLETVSNLSEQEIASLLKS